MKPPPVKYEVKISIKGNGKSNPSGTIKDINPGSSVTVVATPDPDNVLFSAILTGREPLTISKLEGDISIDLTDIKANAELKLDFLTKMLYTLVKPGKPYHLDSMKVHNSNNILVMNITVTDAEKNDEYSFTYPDMRFVCKSPDGRQSSSPFTLSGSVLTLGSPSLYIQESRTNENKLVFRTPPEPKPGYVGLVTTEYVYVRR